MKKKYIGIDFGMQYLKVCYFDGIKNNQVDLEGNQENAIGNASRNVVFYEEDEEQVLKKYFFGSGRAEEARKYGESDYVRYIKRELQKEKSMRSVCDGKYVFSALEIITHIFERVHFKMAEERCDTNAPTILTVPVVFSEAQKDMLKYCAEQAGFSVQEIITEPFAVLFSDTILEECIDDMEDEANDLAIVFDFGASTIDVCLAKISKADEAVSVETIGSSGLSYGGKDVTDLIKDYLLEKYADIAASEIQNGMLDEESKECEFFELAERLKTGLYESDDEDDEIPEVSEKFYGSKVVLKNETVKELLNASGIWNKIVKMLSDMFDATDEYDADDFSEVSKVIMTGGTSKITYFRKKIKDLFSIDDIIGNLEDESIYCSVSSGAVNYALREDINITNRSPMNIGIEIGHGFEMELRSQSTYNVFGRRKKVPVDWLNKNDWKIKVYQTLQEVREHSNVEQADILYAGFVQLNRKLYSSDEDAVYIRLQYTKKGIIATVDYGDEDTTVEKGIFLKTEVTHD